MKLRFQWRMTAYFVLLCLLFIGIYGYLYFSMKVSWFLSSLLGLLPVSFFAYLMFRNLAYPLRRMTEVVGRLTADHPIREIYPYDELGNLSRIIDEIADQFRKKIAEVSEDKEYLQTILKGMMEGVLVVDEKKRIKMMNEALRSLLSVALLMLRIRPHWRSFAMQIWNPRSKGCFRAVIAKLSRWRFLRPGARRLKSMWYAISSPGKDSIGKALGAIAVFHDITRLKRLEKVRQDFVANVSHELRTPLTTIKGYAETLLRAL